MSQHWVNNDHKCKYCNQDLLRLTTTSECPVDRRRSAVSELIEDMSPALSQEVKRAEIDASTAKLKYLASRVDRG